MDTPVTEPAKALRDVALLLESLEIPYFLVGSFASGIHGEFRATNDIDIVCRFSPAKLEAFEESVTEKFICDDVAFARAVREQKSYNIFHEETFVKIDLFFSLGAFEQEEFSRARSFPIPGVSEKVNVSSLEYNILAKLRWYMKSGEQLATQLRDVRAMVRINSDNLDVRYLREWAKELNVEQYLGDVGLPCA